MRQVPSRVRTSLFVSLPLLLLLLLVVGGARFFSHILMPPDTQCTTRHQTTEQAPARLDTAADYYQQANYDYATGDCVQALAAYTRSIELDPSDARVYNDRAYTAMRMQRYADALPDLNRALELRPDYVQALMNRGDLYNYYGPIIDRRTAIRDYDRVIALGANQSQTSVCGHRFLAMHEGWNAGTVLGMITGAAFREGVGCRA